MARGALAVVCLWLALSVWTAVPAAAEDDPGQEPYGAEDAGAEDDPVHIPEPMVFDLVRGLGAEKGEFEANVLSCPRSIVGPTTRSSRRPRSSSRRSTASRSSSRCRSRARRSRGTS